MLRIHITVRIRIRLFTLMRIRIQLFTLIRIRNVFMRIRILIKSGTAFSLWRRTGSEFLKMIRIHAHKDLYHELKEELSLLDFDPQDRSFWPLTAAERQLKFTKKFSVSLKVLRTRLTEVKQINNIIIYCQIFNWTMMWADFRSRDILVRIQTRIPDPWLYTWFTDPDLDPAFVVGDFQNANKN